MFRLWAKVYQDSHILRDMVAERSERRPIMELVDDALGEICLDFDLQKPMWLPDNTKDFRQFRLTRFTAQHFIETIDFDYLEIELIEEDSL